MPDLEEFKDKHKGEELIVIGNGPGLKNIPFAFLESRPNFALNFFSAWVPFLVPDYWLVLDPLCFGAVEYVNGVTKFVKEHNASAFVGACLKLYDEFDETDVVFYKMMEHIDGIAYSPLMGVQYTSSAIAAAHVAVEVMGVSKILLVGQDNTYGMMLYEDMGEGSKFKGLSRIPHFYDPRSHFNGYADAWDEQWGFFRKWAEERGTEVVNLSIPTQCRSLERGDYRDYWSPPE